MLDRGTEMLKGLGDQKAKKIFQEERDVQFHWGIEFTKEE